MSNPTPMWLATDGDGSRNVTLWAARPIKTPGGWWGTGDGAACLVREGMDDHPLAPLPGECIPVWLTTDEPEEDALPVISSTCPDCRGTGGKHFLDCLIWGRTEDPTDD